MRIVNSQLFFVFRCIAVPPKLAPFAIADEPLYLGDFFQLNCAVVHGDFPYNITWYFNDRPIIYVDGVSILMNGKRSSSLNVDSVAGQHAGNYTCVASNIGGSTYITTTLSIRGSLPPCFLKLSLSIQMHFYLASFAQTLYAC